MKTKNLLIFTIFSIITIILSISISAQPKIIKQDLSASLPIDPNVTIGKLDNGITYYIRTNKKPEKRAELRLAVNAGSVLEDDDQQGLAHLCEHMAFNGTKNFKKQELVNYLESIGMRFGPELNAYTSFDETVYMLTIPTDNDSIVKTAFQILEDWSHNISLEGDEIDKERGVVIEEWRLGRGAEARMRDKQFPVLFKDSRYAERLPIGKKEILETFKHETIRKFYKDWYRPDLMAVVAVGDFDKSKIEQLIKSHFSKLVAPKKSIKRTVFPVPDHNEPLFAVATDPEATMSRVSIYYKHDQQKEKTIADYKKNILKSLYDGMLNNRLRELTKQADPAYLTAYSSGGSFVRSKDIYVLTAAVKDNGIERGMETLLTEAVRVKKFGFTASELERQKSEQLRFIKQAYNERDKTESRFLVSEYVSHFLSEEPITGIEFEYDLHKKLLPGINLDDVNRLAAELITNKNRVVMVNAPEKAGLTAPTQEILLNVFETASKKDIIAYEDKVSTLPLVADPPAPVTTVQEIVMKDLGVTEWKLSNGVRVVLKPTDFKNDQILLSAISPGGNSLVNDKDYISASTATSIIQESGLANFDQITLQKMLQGKIVNLSPYIGELEEGFSGNAAPQDFETMLQLIYQYFNSPRLDSVAFLSYKERMKGFLHNRSARPESAFEDTLLVTLAQYHNRRKPWTEATLDEINPQSAYSIFKNRFEDASDFTFIITGAFKPEEIKPLVLTYLGGLPSKNRKESWQDVGISPPTGVISKSVKKGIEQKSQVRIVFTGPFDWSRENRHALQSMVSVMRIKLREAIREEKGGTYGVSVMASTSQFPKPEYRITVTWGCAPDRVQELIQTAMGQIDSLRNYPVTDIYITKVKETQRREREVSLKENRFWSSSLQFAYSNFEDPMDILRYDELIEKVNSDYVQKTAQKYFDMKNYVEVVLYPENK
ncbi:MAG: insulinase family protein [Bacteroidetes bacterium]|nr:insulinase family protein [Bacteroidota bacterium]MBU1422261.1 insulinase family protein [Bacteroidota bacterium]